MIKEEPRGGKRLNIPGERVVKRSKMYGEEDGVLQRIQD